MVLETTATFIEEGTITVVSHDRFIRHLSTCIITHTVSPCLLMSLCHSLLMILVFLIILALLITFLVEAIVNLGVLLLLSIDLVMNVVLNLCEIVARSLL